MLQMGSPNEMACAYEMKLIDSGVSRLLLLKICLVFNIRACCLIITESQNWQHWAFIEFHLKWTILSQILEISKYKVSAHK